MTIRRIGLCWVALAMFSIASGPCAVLQTLAWTEMLRDYCQRSGSVVVAVAQIFDGNHPCDLCRKIASVKSQEKSSVPAKSASYDDTKVKALCESKTSYTRFPMEGNIPYPACVLHDVRRFDAPPTPPPRRGGLTA